MVPFWSRSIHNSLARASTSALILLKTLHLAESAMSVCVWNARSQANQLSHDLCRILRHTICNCRGSTFKCDEGGWVDIDAIITDYGVDLFPPNTSKERRYIAIVEVMKWQDSGYRKSRFQILAVRFPSIMNPNDMRAARQELLYMGRTQDEVNEIFSRCAGWYRPWCIRGFMSSEQVFRKDG